MGRLSIIIAVMRWNLIFTICCLKFHLVAWYLPVDRRIVCDCRRFLSVMRLFAWLSCDIGLLGCAMVAQGLPCARLLAPRPQIAGSWAEGLAQLIPRTEGLLRAKIRRLVCRSTQNWVKVVCIQDKFGEPEIITFFEKAGIFNGSLLGELRFFDQSSGGTLVLWNLGFGAYWVGFWKIGATKEPLTDFEPIILRLENKF